MTCAVVGCNNSKRTKGLSFYEIPKIKYNEGCTVLDLTRKRRRLWLNAINRDDISMESNKDCHNKVCAHHFISGRPAYYRMELDPDWIPNKNLPSESQIEKNSSSTDPHHRQRTKRKSKDNAARGQANKKRQIDDAVSQSTQNPAWDCNDAESEKEQDLHLTDAKDEEDLNPKLEELTYIKKESLLCEYPKCAEVKKELFKDLQNALLVEKQLRAMIKYLESISNVNLDLLQVCLDMHHDPAVEAEFKKVIDMVQTIMNLEMWELKAQKRAKYTTSDPALKTVASISHKSTSSTSADLLDYTDINHCNDNNADNHSPSTEITHFKNNHTFTSQKNYDAATETKDNTTSISNAETISNINANTTTSLKDANTTTEMSEWINANTSSLSHVNISSPTIKTRMSAINDDDITSLTAHNYPKQRGLPKALKIFLVSPSGPKNFTHTLVSKSTSTIPTSVRRSEGANSYPNLSGVPDYDGCIGICNKFVNIIPSSASCPTQICGRTRMLCEICGKLIACSRSSAEAFKLHVKRVHSGERPHKCDQCGKRFVCKRHLTYHLHLHSGERSYQCEDCGKSFKSKSNLQQHQMVHNNDAKMHECSLCDYKCIWPGNLKMHMKNRHSISVSSDSTNAIPLQEEWKELAQ